MNRALVICLTLLLYSAQNLALEADWHWLHQSPPATADTAEDTAAGDVTEPKQNRHDIKPDPHMCHAGHEGHGNHAGLLTSLALPGNGVGVATGHYQFSLTAPPYSRLLRPPKLV